VLTSDVLRPRTALQSPWSGPNLGAYLVVIRFVVANNTRASKSDARKQPFTNDC
jgi:hypothetical protein